MKNPRTRRTHSFSRQFGAFLLIAGLLTRIFAGIVDAQNMSAGSAKGSSRLTEDQRILHVLNRLGFGARPGDVERVKSMGVDKYIETQLWPEKIDDSASEAKLQNLETLRMSTAELYERYPQPGQLLKQLQKRDGLPADLAAARENRVKGGANAANANQAKTGEAMPNEMPAPANANNPNANPTANDQNPMNNPQYRQALMAYFKENNLRPAAFLTGELQMSRILRAVYSERQLQEVMVDFWTNQFNVFAVKAADRGL